MPIVALDTFLAHLGVADDDPEVDDATSLHAAIDAEVKRLAHRDFEGDGGGSYTEIIRIDGAEEFVLPHVPVDELTSIARARFDGTIDDPYDATAYRLDSAARGLVVLRPWCGGWDHHHTSACHHRGPARVQVVWTTTGAIPADVAQAFLDWGSERWDERGERSNLAGYQTGQDAEQYFQQLAGRPPRSALTAILANAHVNRGGPI